jgi:copper(I)-binding protein
VRIIGAVLIGLCLATAGCKADVAKQPVEVTRAWVRLPAAPGVPGAGYFTLRSAAEATLVGLSSPQIKRIELHDTRMTGGMAHMEPMQGLELPAGEKVEFGPGGRHAMLWDIDPSIKPGDKIKLVFTLDMPKQVLAEADATVIAAGAAPPTVQ